jgi:hypothetical protein
MRSETTLELIEQQLQMNCGDVLAAAKAVGVSLIFINQWRKDDKIVNDRLTEAERVGAQGLVSAAIERATRGVDKAVYFKGEVVGYDKVYSDGLLNTLLKAKVAEFAKDGEGGSGINVHVNVANIMPRAKTYDEWLTMKRATVDAPALEHDSTKVIDVEHTLVEDAFKGIEL